MKSGDRDLLTVLKIELAFLENGGYKHPVRAAWRPQFLFQDSPTCPNFDPAHKPTACSECILMELIPKDARGEKIPCRSIPLDEHGKTIDWFYRYGTPEELEVGLRQWLRTTIRRLEREKREALRNCEHPEVCVQARFVSDD